MDIQGEREGGGMNWEIDIDPYTWLCIYTITANHRELYSMLYDDLNWKEILKKSGCMYIYDWFISLYNRGWHNSV